MNGIDIINLWFAAFFIADSLAITVIAGMIVAKLLQKKVS